MARVVTDTASAVEYVEAGCVTCHGPNPQWFSANAVAVAARHHQATGHPTWARQTLITHFGDPATAPPQLPGIDPLTPATTASG